MPQLTLADPLRHLSLTVKTARLFPFLAQRSCTALVACSAFLMLILTTACGPQTSVATDRAALVLLYEATDGPNWIRNANWLSDAPLDQWAGVTTGKDGRVIGLDLFRNNVSGVIPTDVGNLDKLVVLNVGNTQDTFGSQVAEVLVGFATLLELILTGDAPSTTNPPDYNDFYGCIPSRLQGNVDIEQSNLGRLPFCDGTNEAANTNSLALEYAVQRGDPAAVQRLLRDGVDIACSDDSGRTVLHVVLTQGNVEIVRMLAERCAEDLDDVSSHSLYELALRQGVPGLVQALVDAGINPNCSNESGRTLLHAAVADEHVELTRTLAERCSEALNAVSTSYFDDQTPLSLAIGSGNQELARVLIDAGADPNTKVEPDYEVGSHLAYAVEEGDLEIVRLLLEAGADPNVSDADLGAPSYRATPLDRAFHNERADLVRILVVAGADLGAMGDSMLSAAITSGRAEMVSVLVEAGANVDGRDAKGRPLLYWAILAGSAEMVAILVEGGADVNATDAGGEHILFDAILHGSPEVVEVLVNAGADVNARDDRGRSVLAKAKLFNSPETVRILVNAGAKE